MDLIETTQVPDGVLPTAAFRAHLRLGTGFADETSGDAQLLRYLRAAIGVIEGRTGKALVRRSFRLVLSRWRWADAQALPVAPVASVASLTLRDGVGAPSVVDAARWRLVADRHRPRIVATGAVLPAIPAAGQAEIDFEAGFATTWDGVPDDLAQAVFLLAAHYHEARTGAAPELPVSVASLLGRWAPMRLSAGGARG